MQAQRKRKLSPNNMMVIFLKFITSKLKDKDSFKIGASGLKHKRVRLFFTIILSFISITFFALTDTMSAFKGSNDPSENAQVIIRNFKRKFRNDLKTRIP